MNDIYAHVSVRILEKEYQVSCPASERTDLLDSAETLNAKMREIRGMRRPNAALVNQIAAAS